MEHITFNVSLSFETDQTALYEKKHNIKQFDEKKKLKLARMELLSTLHKVAGDNLNKNPVHHI
jgi:hypothetical protein